MIKGHVSPPGLVQLIKQDDFAPEASHLVGRLY